ncbi:unnamed protein product [Psylliodes chrysocephalus]|uniref:Uncharacterized protein n=1 Tax=Psylliodes chrysocephalus TaxID=3402493 RepID=A0A9P0GBI2_9CUCU|nr:unnamed protein product [Psylliodes chrysocephala]
MRLRNEQHDLTQMRASLKAKLESRFSSLSEDPTYLIATFLDPRFKTNYLGAVEFERARQKILLEYLKMTCDESFNSGSSSGFPIPIKRVRETNSNVTCESHDTFWNCFDEVANKNNIQCRDQEKNPIANEIDYYLKTVRIDRSRDPYTWRSVNSKHYPYLTKFAKAGLVYENKRNRLPP